MKTAAALKNMRKKAATGCAYAWRREVGEVEGARVKWRVIQQARGLEVGRRGDVAGHAQAS